MTTKKKRSSKLSRAERRTFLRSVMNEALDIGIGNLDVARGKSSNESLQIAHEEVERVCNVLFAAAFIESMSE